MEWLQQVLSNLRPSNVFMGLSLVIGGLVILRILWKVQRATNELDFSDWLRGADGKASWSKAAAIGGFMVGSWCLITITLAGKVPDGYWLLFLTYFAIVIGNPAALELVKQRDPRAPPSTPNQEFRVNAPADAEVSIKSPGQST